jgi:RNA polymerase-associated protein CTR9
LEKARELYQKVLVQKPNNMYAANGLGVVLAEKGLFDVAKDIFTQVRSICRIVFVSLEILLILAS